MNLDYIENYKMLANAIVVRAALDYKEYTKAIHEGNKKSQMYKLAVKDFGPLIKFFDSEWYKLLAPEVDSKYLVSRLDKDLIEAGYSKTLKKIKKGEFSHD